MQIKRFEAPDMQQALRRVKKALEPEAIILFTKSLKKSSGKTRAFSQMIVEVAAVIDLSTGECRRTGEEGRLSVASPGDQEKRILFSHFVLKRIQWN